MENYKERVENISTEFRKVLEKLNKDQLSFKGKGWSIEENLRHLVASTKSYIPIIDGLERGTYKTGFLSKWGWYSRFLGNLILQSVQKDRKKKMKTFPVWEPAQYNQYVGENLLEEFFQSQELLVQLYNRSIPFLQTQQVIASPANSNIYYRLDTAFEIISNHQLRHLEQIKEIISKELSQG